MNTVRPEIFSQLAPGLRRVLASNASPMTYWGTNTYIVGTGQVAVIDPGPNDPVHLENILGALTSGEVISHILVTHSHVDHSPLARQLSHRTGAPVYAYGGSGAGRSEIMQTLAKLGDIGGGEGVDTDFNPDSCLHDQQVLAGDGWQLRALWTPGHMGNHLCFEFGEYVFSGDHVMGWASSLVSPPDGDLTDFMTSTRKLAQIGAKTFLPGHGAPVENPKDRANWLISHRESRELSIMHTLGDGPADIATLTRHIYKDTPAPLIAAAERNVFAHLIALVQAGKVTPLDGLSFTSRFKTN